MAMSQQPERTDRIVDGVVAALVPPITPIALGSLEARERRDVQKEVERQIERALWRAERRARQVPAHVRRSMSFVMKRRRQIAYEIVRALRSLGAGELLSSSIAERGANRYPRDGIILPDTTERPERPERPRAAGGSPRQRGTNPRAAGTSLRQRRAAADLTLLTTSAMPTPIHAPPTATPAPPREREPRDASGVFAAELERQTRALMVDMAAGANVTSGMNKAQRAAFFARVQAIRDADRQ